MHVHVGAAAGWIGAETDREAATGHVRLTKSRQCQRCSGSTSCRRMQGQAGETRGSLTVYPGETEVLRRHAPDRRSVTRVEADTVSRSYFRPRARLLNADVSVLSGSVRRHDLLARRASICRANNAFTSRWR
jgi:hypothetical protein